MEQIKYFNFFELVALSCDVLLLLLLLFLLIMMMTTIFISSTSGTQNILSERDII